MFSDLSASWRGRANSSLHSPPYLFICLLHVVPAVSMVACEVQQVRISYRYWLGLSIHDLVATFLHENKPWNWTSREGWKVWSQAVASYNNFARTGAGSTSATGGEKRFYFPPFSKCCYWSYWTPDLLVDSLRAMTSVVALGSVLSIGRNDRRP